MHTNKLYVYVCMYVRMYVPEFNQGHPHRWSYSPKHEGFNDSHSQHPPVVNSSSEKARDLSIHPSSLRQDLSLTLEFEISSDHEAFKSSSSHSSPPLVEFWAHTSWPAFTWAGSKLRSSCLNSKRIMHWPHHPWLCLWFGRGEEEARESGVQG